MQNAPEYIVVDEFGIKDADDQLTSGILYEVKQTLGLDVLNYQYGSVEELNATMQEWGETKKFAEFKFPLVFILQPFKIKRGFQNYFGRITGMKIFIINKSDENKKAKDRMTDNFKPILLPIYRELLKQIDLSVPFTGTEGPGERNIKHDVIDMYYWSEQSKRFLNDIVDTVVMDDVWLDVNHKENCLPFKSF